MQANLFKYVVMGVSGSGKTTIASMLANRIEGTFLDADEFHSETSRKKMASGQPLDDDDRAGWLERLSDEIKSHDVKRCGPLFLACSALKVKYRDVLRNGDPELKFIWLTGNREVLLERLKGREDHFMPPELLDSQLSTLEEPQNALVVDVESDENSIVDFCLEQLGLD
ncbi:MAG: gluconokinase [Planctomycetota bacterium]